jgi:Brp/Blh family beta-carotene 15,15'-monooxygenase
MFYKKRFDWLTWINAGIGLGMVVWQYINGNIPFGFQLFYFLFLIGATGIPHGALDHVIAKNTEKDSAQFSIQSFFKKYILAILLYTASWIFLPSFSLLVFLIISAWHFGETDLAEAQNNFSWNAARLSWGTLVLYSLLIFHPTETEQVLIRITQGSEMAMSIWTFVKNNNQLGLLLCSSVFLLLAFLSNRKHKIRLQPGRLINLFIILAICKFLPLLPAFALYFGGWHAIRSFEIIFTFLHQKGDESASGPLEMWKNALPMTFLAAFGFIFLAYIWNGAGLKTDPIPALFIFLSIITLPHLDVMDKLVKNRSKN